jgi:ABC-type lipoprotein export system ATPase subunit
MGAQIQIIDGSGVYQDENVQDFIEQHDLPKAGVKYTTVAIMGPQSSGKSTLLNAVVRSLCLPSQQTATDMPRLVNA